MERMAKIEIHYYVTLNEIMDLSKNHPSKIIGSMVEAKVCDEDPRL
jgi:hypothetical protein